MGALAPMLVRSGPILEPAPPMAWQAKQASSGRPVDAFAEGGVAAGDGLAGESLEFGGGELHIGEREPGGFHESLDEGLILTAFASGTEAGSLFFGTSAARRGPALRIDRRERQSAVASASAVVAGEDVEDIGQGLGQIGAGEGDDGFAADGGRRGIAGEVSEFGDDGGAAEFAEGSEGGGAIGGRGGGLAGEEDE